MTLSLRVTPRSSRSGPIGILGEQLKWGVHAAANDGQANREVIESVAKYFHLAKSLVEITAGETSRSKTVFLEAISLEQVLIALEEVLSS